MTGNRSAPPEPEREPSPLPPGRPDPGLPEPALRFELAGLPRVAVLTAAFVLLYLFLLWLGRDVPLAVSAPALPAPGPLRVETVAPPRSPAPPVVRPVAEEPVVVRPIAPPAPAVAAPSPAVPAASASAPYVEAPASSGASDAAPRGEGSRPMLFHVAAASAGRIVYLVDVSGSMLNPLDPEHDPNGRTRFDAAAEEVRRSVRALSPETEFDILLFGNRAVAMAPAAVPATPEAKRQAEAFLAHLPDVGGGTDFVAGIGAALRLAPGTLFLLTDGGANDPPWLVVRKIAALQSSAPAPTRIYAFGMTPVLEDDGDELLQKLCHMSGGTFQPMTRWNRQPANPAPAR